MPKMNGSVIEIPISEVLEGVPVSPTRWHIETEAGEPDLQCWHCELPCAFIELGFEVPLHPGVCTDARWDEYFLELATRRLSLVGRIRQRRTDPPL